MEELKGFNAALEYLLPHMFRGVTATYKSLRRWSKRQNKTKVKEGVTDEDVMVLERYLKPERHLYQFARERFHVLQQAIATDAVT